MRLMDAPCLSVCSGRPGALPFKLSDCLRNARAVGRIRLGAVFDMQLLHRLRYAVQRSCRVIEQGLLLRYRHLAE
jgi:hypothetical protein